MPEEVGLTERPLGAPCPFTLAERTPCDAPDIVCLLADEEFDDEVFFPLVDWDVKDCLLGFIEKSCELVMGAGMNDDAGEGNADDAKGRSSDSGRCAKSL